MKAAIIGSGAWGTALGIRLCANGHQVVLWSHNPTKAEEMAVSRENPLLAGVRLPDGMTVSADPACVADCVLAVIASPSFAIRSVCRSVAPYLHPDAVMVSVTKGIEPDTLMRMSEIVAQETNRPVVALTGPSHAEEVALGVPTGCVAASPVRAHAEFVQDAFMSDAFRIYTSPDIVGAELGGAIKNVIALCAGVTDGMGCGDNTKAMLLTRGLAEMARLGVSMGADRDTFAGLAGVGDLTVTCTSRHSRNCRAGTLIGKGIPVEEVMAQSKSVVEGYYAARSIWLLAQKQGVDMPIIEATYRVLYQGESTKNVVSLLMQRRRKAESDVTAWQ
jgi:glycerol-3-phosphate dehydrogenase (NAD(P)+)